ncbi:hypothetical protein [Campylobacter mucosalis]|uniref:Uncharacterized protein n=1 Tax=Campylobacter mucosalis CCUG 21559 TaxID=1032067 RepID=A0A6G5QJ20_9BACT|nr:hypothetical protein [Campylobacter mucosalis]QCD45660.1 hypothetical protein CMUC_1919 [Campylobacter mucosalis CCUG 21559]
MKQLYIFFIALFFNGCIGRYGCNDGFFSNIASINVMGTYIEEWYIDPNNPNSRMLGGSTADYGASAQKKKHNYIVKYFTLDCNEITRDNIFRIDSLSDVDRTWLAYDESLKRKKKVDIDEILKEYRYERRYYYIKDQKGNYQIDSEIKSGDNALVAINQCFDDGYCKTHKYLDGKTYYILKKYLTPSDE